jgi:hypothetical protein
MALIGDGAQWRKLRKAYGNFLSQKSSLGYRDMQLRHARAMAKEIEREPGKWQTSLSRYHSQEWFEEGTVADEL